MSCPLAKSTQPDALESQRTCPAWPAPSTITFEPELLPVLNEPETNGAIGNWTGRVSTRTLATTTRLLPLMVPSARTQSWQLRLTSYLGPERIESS